ncbi:hypothetical protein GX51_02636 [Blastomyces parvus]|uniref:Uncharacterized protein n=1 Tax=Blastomyces parvus TaxID=2060905 RepID=A0A2B7XAN4_9EURO|nr:hypothetical protein GX51_02636 [Blastomyces parvus]
MGITWDKNAIDRIIGALLAAHPGFNPNYKAIAGYFGQGATYDSIQGRFRTYHKMADKMREDNPNPEAASSCTPVRRTTSNGRVRKLSSTPKGRRTKAPLTPTKPGKTKTEHGIHEVISIDEESDCFIKHDSSVSAPFEEGPIYDTITPGGKFRGQLPENNMGTGGDGNGDFLGGLKDAATNLKELGDAAQYSSEIVGFAEYDDTV